MDLSRDLYSFNSLFEIHMKSKEKGGILARPASKKGKTITSETHHVVSNDYEDNNFSR